MLSSDKNVESIAKLVETLKSYVGLQGEYLKLDVVEKVVRIVTAMTLGLIVCVMVVAVAFYLSFAAVYWMAPSIGMAAAFAVVAAFFVALLAVVFIFRKPWIERPLVKFMVSILMS